MYENSLIEIDRRALLFNIQYIKKTLPQKTATMCVVKANAYGHGLAEIISLLKDEVSVDWFAVFDFQDALFIRKYSTKPILVLVNTLPIFWEEARKKNISITISSFETLESLISYTHHKKIHFHVKVDTGLGRQGFLMKDMSRVMALLDSKRLVPQGLYSHFSGVEETQFDQYSMEQYKKLLDWKYAFADIHMHPRIHMSATAGVLRYTDFACDIARIGIGMYGLWPSADTRESQKKDVLKPVLSWKTYISEIKNVEKGSAIAYDLTYRVDRASRIAILPVGYFDGLPRSLSNKGYVLVNGQKAPILGRIMMNMCVVDVTDISKARSGDEVVLIGKQKKEILSAETLAHMASTINYELVTRLYPFINRVILPLQKKQK